jgi:hypothetical protein
LALTENQVSNISPDSKKSLKIPIIFTLTSFIGAALLFIVEPLVAKLLLPEFGGSSSVWTLSTFFFQAIMLLGYLFIHFTAKLGPRKQPLWQLALVIPALLFLPLALPAMEGIPTQEPFSRILLTLVILVGLPFLVISTTGPLIQRWYSWTDSPRNDDPYFIYAASNAGSFIGLLAYPFLIEPFMSLDAQRDIWSIGFVAFLMLVGICGLIVIRQNKKAVSESLTQVSKKTISTAGVIIEKLTFKRQVWWILLAFIPASLQLGLVSHITTDIASFPLLWIIPLTIYLATMIAAFARKSRKPPHWAIISGSVFAVVSVYIALAIDVTDPLLTLFIMILFMVTLALVSYAAHGSLAADRPSTTHLTKYFVLISLGGAIGGAFNGLIAPLVFTAPLEFPIVLIMSLLMLTILLKGHTLKYSMLILLSLFSLIVVATGGFANKQGVVSEGRSFYGSWEVRDQYANAEKDILRTFSHGTTIHGDQLRAEGERSTPTSYYALGGPLSNLVDDAMRNSNPEITVIGLGAGTMAAYANDETTMRFIEVDKQVIDVAENPEMFTYLSDARKRGATIETVLGDGRMMVEELEAGSQDLIVVDAFSSDSIPVHLLTEEAFAIYKSKLKPGGILAVHISNRVFNLEPVVVNNSEKLGFESLLKIGEGHPESKPYQATWMALTTDSTVVDRLKSIPKLPSSQEDSLSLYDLWIDGAKDKTISWTDDHSSILEAIAK